MSENVIIPQIITSQRTMKLTPQKFKPNTSMIFDFPPNQVVKSFYVQLKGHIDAEFTTKPTVHRYGLMDALFQRIQVQLDGGEVIKSVTPEWMREEAVAVHGKDIPSFHKVNSSSLGDEPVQGYAQLGTTGQKTAVLETIEIPFENKRSSEWWRTFLNLRGLNHSFIEITTRDFQDYIQAGTPVGDAVLSGELEIQITLKTAPAFINQSFDIYKQTFKESELTGMVNDRPYELSIGGNIQGLYCLLENGAESKRLNMDELDKVKVQLVKNGTELLKDSTLLNVQQMTAGDSPRDNVVNGGAYINMLNNKSYDTALNTGHETDVKNLDLKLTTPSSLSYSPNPVKLIIRQNEIVKRMVK